MVKRGVRVREGRQREMSKRGAADCDVLDRGRDDTVQKRGGEITDTEKKSVAMKGPKRSENKNVAEQVR